MGVVFEAEDTTLDRRVALKVMQGKALENALARERFLREAKAAAALKHEHVVTIYQVGEDRGVPFIALEFLQGEPLDVWIKQHPRATVAQVLRIGRETAEGLAAAHAKGLVHRDIKPANIWLEAPKGLVKILDFGLARSTTEDTHLTSEGAVVGTPAFMSPEQARGDSQLDHRTDLFSLGVVLYRMLTGQQPFNGPTIMALLMSLGVDTPKPVRELNPEVPERLAKLVHALLSKDAAGRPASAEAVARELHAIEQPLGLGGAAPVVVYVPPAEVVPNPWENIDASSGSLTAAEPVPASGRAPVGRAPDVSPGSASGAPKPPRTYVRGSPKKWLLALPVLLLALGAGIWFATREKPTPPVVENPPPKPAAPKANTPKPPTPTTPATPSDPATAAAKALQAEWAAKLKLPVESTSPTGIAMVLIPPGEGVEKPFLMGKYEVTQGEWEKVMGNNPSTHSAKGKLSDKVAGLDTSRFPVEKVHWFECVEFCNKLSEKEGLKPYYAITIPKDAKAYWQNVSQVLGGPGYHLPTLNEWMHGGAGGATTTFHFGNNVKDFPEYGWGVDNSDNRPHPVGEKKPNGYGLHDIHGNVSEWCATSSSTPCASPTRRARMPRR